MKGHFNFSKIRIWMGLKSFAPTPGLPFFQSIHERNLLPQNNGQKGLTYMHCSRIYLYECGVRQNTTLKNISFVVLHHPFSWMNIADQKILQINWREKKIPWKRLTDKKCSTWTWWTTQRVDTEPCKLPRCCLAVCQNFCSVSYPLVFNPWNYVPCTVHVPKRSIP